MCFVPSRIKAIVKYKKYIYICFININTHQFFINTLTPSVYYNSAIVKHHKRTGQERASEASERLRLSCLDNRENGGLPNFFAILVVFWERCCGGQKSLLKILKLRILTANRPVELVYESQNFSQAFTKKNYIKTMNFEKSEI